MPNSISITEEAFKKSAKRLCRFIEERRCAPGEIALSEIQEALATSLGLRNLHDAQQRWGPAATPAPQALNPQHRPKTTSLRSSTQFGELVIGLLGNIDADSFWLGRTKRMIAAVATLLTALEDSGEIEFSAEIFRDYLDLETLIKFSTRAEIPEQAKAPLNAYLASLPGYKPDAPKQSETAQEHHGYIQMQSTRVLSELVLVENQDFILLDKGWTDISLNGARALKKSIQEIDYIELAWFHNSAFSKVADKLLCKNNFESLWLSDLIEYKANMIDLSLSADLTLLIQGIFGSFHTAKALSHKIQQANID